VIILEACLQNKIARKSQHTYKIILGEDFGGITDPKVGIASRFIFSICTGAPTRRVRRR
jgi:hypothetical protein